jgi:hypothetical protein
VGDTGNSPEIYGGLARASFLSGYHDYKGKAVTGPFMVAKADGGAEGKVLPRIPQKNFNKSWIQTRFPFSSRGNEFSFKDRDIYPQ